MEEILHHLECINPCKYGINYQPQLVDAGFLNHQQYVFMHFVSTFFGNSFVPLSSSSYHIHFNNKAELWVRMYLPV